MEIAYKKGSYTANTVLTIIGDDKIERPYNEVIFELNKDYDAHIVTELPEDSLFTTECNRELMCSLSGLDLAEGYGTGVKLDFKDNKAECVLKLNIADMKKNGGADIFVSYGGSLHDVPVLSRYHELKTAAFRPA